MPKENLAEVVSMPELDSTSEAEQMYLITVARAAEAGVEGPIPISRIAAELEVSVPSANEMVRKLDNRGLLAYEPYRGVQLTDGGRGIAGQVLRTRRLWATFLAEHLGFSPAAADDQACHLEHATLPEAANRLAAFLGNPEAGPLGRPIPAAVAAGERLRSVRLTEAAVGSRVEVVAVTAPHQQAEFLATEGISVGCDVGILASGASGLLVEAGGGAIHLTEQVASLIAVMP